MDPVIGIDVSKGFSHGQAFLDKNKPYEKSIRFSHDLEGLKLFMEYIRDLEKESGKRPTLLLEATGHYHIPIIQMAEKHEYLLVVLNPLIAQRAKKTNLRKVKTDSVDAYHLAQLYYKEELDPYKKQSIQSLNLKCLTRQHESLTKMYVQTKLKFQAILDQVFPLYTGIFSNMYSHTSLSLLKVYPTPEHVLLSNLKTLAKQIRSKASRSIEWATDKAKKIMAAAKNCPKGVVYESHVFSMELLIKLLFEYKKGLDSLEKQINTLAQQMPGYNLLQSIPGIGDKISAIILSEIGDIERFDHPKKLVAFVGIDPSVFASGKFVATSNRITKRGSKRLRQALYLAVQCGLRKMNNLPLSAYYDKKRQEGKSYKVAIIACVNKLLRCIYAILKSGKAFQGSII